MLLTAFHGLCMAVADSVPGVSGGTIAFILGFYESFLDALHGLFGADHAARTASLRYLLKLGVGWCAGMAACILLLSDLFSRHVYVMSTLFLGLTVASVPFIVFAERAALARRPQGMLLAVLGAALVVGLTLLRTGSGLLGSLDFARLTLPQLIYVFFSGAVAITAMVLPGISGSSILLIAGVYLPAIAALRQFFSLQLSVLPGLLALGLGVLFGIALSIRALRAALRRYRSQMVWLILGLTLGSLYAIVNGPASLAVPLPPLTPETFRPAAFAAGIAVLLGLELLHSCTKKKTAAARAAGKKAVS